MTYNNRKLFGSILGIIIFIICIFSISYAFYSWKSSDTNVDVGIHEGGLKFIYSNNNILSSNTLSPILDYTDSSYYNNNNGSLVYADYTVTNTKSDTYKMITRLNISSISDSLKTDSFKWVLLESVDGSYSNVVDTGNFTNLTVGVNEINTDVYIPPNTNQKEYRFVIYIDGNMENSSDMMNSSLVSDLELCDEKVEIMGITLDNKGATSGQEGTGKIYLKYGLGIYKDSTASTTEMTTTANPITLPGKTGYTFMGYYTEANGVGDKLINENGYITSSFTNTYTNNDITLYAYWGVNKPTASYCSTPTYNGSNQTITKDAGSGYTFSGNTGTNATDYTVTAKLNSGEKWADGTTTDITFTCSIAKRNVTYTADSDSKEYDGTALTKQTATLTSGSLVSGHTATFSITGTITNVGSTTNTLNSVTIKSGSTDVSSNYDITKQNGTLTIITKGIDKPTTSYCSTPTYNGSSQTITKAAGTGYTFSGNTGTNATSYTVTAKLSSNYKWSDNTTADVTFTCSIAKKAVTYTADSASKEYDETALTKQTATLTSGSLVSGHTATFSITGTITNVGSTTNILNSVTIKSGTTDVSSNYDITKKNGTLTVTSKGVSKPTAANYCSTPTYNGSSQTITKAAGTGYTFSGNTGTNATSYTVTAKLSSNYKWSDNTTADVTFTCSIAKRNVTYTADSASKEYDSTALTKQTATLTSGSLVSGHTATFSITGTITNVGSTTNILNSVTIKSGSTDVSSNYDITKKNGTLTVISKGVSKPTAAYYCSTPTYNGSSQTITKAAGTGYTFSGNTGKNATSYTVTAKLSSNYKWSDGTTSDVTFTCSIGKKSITITAANQTVTYGTSITQGTDKVTVATLVSGHTLTSITLTQSTTNVTSSGTITPSAAVIKDSSSTTVTSNYSISYVNGTLTINPKSLTSSMVSISPTSYIYDGTAKTPTVTVTGKGIYTGSVNKTFTISYNTFSITLDADIPSTITGGSSYYSNGTTTLYVRWNKGIYSSSSYSTIISSITMPTATGYTFKGYYTGQNGTGTKRIDENGALSNLTSSTYDSATTLYAYWTRNFTCTSNGGTTTYAGLTWTTISNANGYCELALNKTSNISGSYNNATTNLTNSYFKSGGSDYNSTLASENNSGLISNINTNSGTSGTVSITKSGFWWYASGKVKVGQKIIEKRLGSSTTLYSGAQYTGKKKSDGTSVKKGNFSSTTKYLSCDNSSTHSIGDDINANNSNSNITYNTGCNNSSGYYSKKYNILTSDASGSTSSFMYFTRKLNSGSLESGANSGYVKAKTLYIESCGGGYSGHNDSIKATPNDNNNINIKYVGASSDNNIKDGTLVIKAAGSGLQVAGNNGDGDDGYNVSGDSISNWSSFKGNGDGKRVLFLYTQVDNETKKGTSSHTVAKHNDLGGACKKYTYYTSFTTTTVNYYYRLHIKVKMN